MTAEASPLDGLVEVITGTWRCAILGAAVTHRVFDHLEQADSVAGVARVTGISTRGAQALLDGLLALGLVRRVEERYRNAPEASLFLVEGSPGYLGGIVSHTFRDMLRWSRLADVALTGCPVAADTADVPNNAFWESLVPATVVVAAPIAELTAARLGIPEAGAISWLDVGGGSGIYSVTWLALNGRASATQLDWTNVNRLARALAVSRGVADRFVTIDGDYHTIDFGEARYDIAICSNISQMESPDENRRLFRRLRRALKPGGTLLVSDLVLNDDRTGHPFALLFSSMMLLQTTSGGAHRRADYFAWLAEAGFDMISLESTPTPTSLIYAR